MQVNQRDFVRWRDDPITKKLIDYLELEITRLEEEILDPELALMPNSTQQLAFMGGQRFILDWVLQFRDVEFVEESPLDE